MPRRPSHLFLLAACAALAPCTCALAQDVRWRDLQVVDPGVADLGPLSISTRSLPIDLRSPSGFDRVYRVPGSTRGVGGFNTTPVGERLARVDGGITAVFDRSEYVQTKQGIRPVFPANTIFYIGDSPLLNLPDAGRPRERSVNAVSYAFDMQASSLAAAPARAAAEPADFRVHPGEESLYQESARPMKADEPAPAANVFTDEQFRRERIRALLMSALARSE